MVVLSKPLFYSKLPPHVGCRHVFHEDYRSCFEANLKLPLLHFGVGVFYFYLPIYIIKLIIDYKKLDKRYFKKFLVSYLRSCCFGTGFGALVLTTICLNYNILGRLGYNGVSFMPGFVAGISLLFEDDKNRTLNAALWASLAIEAFFKNAYYFDIVKYTPLRETLLFMLTSSSLMYLLMKVKNRKNIPANLWFYFPSITEDYYRVFNLRNYVTKFFKHFGIGFGLGSARAIANGIIKIRKHSAKSLITSILTKKNLKFGAFFGAYVATFEIVMHLLKKYNNDDLINAAIAGFMAGATYHIRPTTQLLTIAIVTTIQILYKDTTTTKFSTKMHLSVLVYMICNGILFKNRLMAAPTCPKYYTNMTRIATSGFLDRVYSTMVDKYLKGGNGS